MRKIVFVLLILSSVACKRVPKAITDEDVKVDTVISTVDIVKEEVVSENVIEIDKSVEKAVLKFFEGVKNSDSISIATAFTSNATITSYKNDTLINTISHNEFVKSALLSKEKEWDESISKVKVDIYNNIATLNCFYEFYMGEEFHYSGDQSVQLVKINDQWKIQSILYDIK